MSGTGGLTLAERGATVAATMRPERRDNDAKPLQPNTFVKGLGYDPTLSEGALKPPIFLTSTFVFESAAAGKRHLEGVTGKRPAATAGIEAI